MSNNEVTLSKLNADLKAGRTVYISTYTKATRITPKTAAKWEASGIPMFKLASDGRLMMANGRGYVTIANESGMLLVGISAQ